MRKPKFGSGEIIIMIVIGLIALIVLTGNGREVLAALYSPTAILIVIVMLIEYLLLKGSDRSAIYRREFDAARQKRRGDLLAMRELEGELTRLQGELEARLAQNEPEGWRAALHQARSASEAMLRQLRERI